MLGLGNTVFYSVGGLFPDHWDSVFFAIVDNHLEVVVSVRLGFHFTGVGGGVSMGNDSAN